MNCFDIYSKYVHEDKPKVPEESSFPIEKEPEVEVPKTPESVQLTDEELLKIASRITELMKSSTDSGGEEGGATE